MEIVPTFFRCINGNTVFHRWAMGQRNVDFVLHLVLFRADDSTNVGCIATIFDIFWREQVGGRDRYGTNFVKS